MVRRIKLDEIMDVGAPQDGRPWICDWRSYDITETVCAAIRNAAPGLVAISLSMMGGRDMINGAETAARDRGIRILWWFGPNINDISQEGRAWLRNCVRLARINASVRSDP